MAATTASDTSTEAARLGVVLTRLSRQMRRQADTGLSPSQLAALTTIERHGPMTLGALAEHERVAPPSITKVVGKLSQAGLILRTVDPDDRRSTTVSLTREGVALLAASRKRKNAWLAGQMNKLEPADLATVVAAIGALEALAERTRR